MAILKGTAGSVVFSNASLVDGIKTWSLDVAAAELNASDFGRSWSLGDSGVKEWSGSFEGNYDDTDAQQALIWSNMIGGVKGLMLFGMGTLTHFYGTVIMTGHSPAQSFGELGAAGWNFKGHGPLMNLPAQLDFILSGNSLVTSQGEVTWQS